MESKDEKRFIQRLEEYPEKTVLSGEHAVVEGFSYLRGSEYRQKPGAVQSRLKQMREHQRLRDLVRLGRNAGKLIPSVRKNIRKNYTDMESYLEALEQGEKLPESPEPHDHKAIWEELVTYAWETHRVRVGFTDLPREYVFEGKGVPFRYALVFVQEMDKEAIEKAPELDAGIEVITVYNSLGIATNDIANWLREKHGIVCMANHPLGGLVDTVPLAERAGLGAIGRHGLLITKDYGPRCRISPIFVDKQLFDYTHTDAYDWIPSFCQKCGKCYRSCPTQAIFEKPELEIDYGVDGPGNRYMTYDREKCYTSFASSMGCAVCISVCPFSRNPGAYDKMRRMIEGKKDAE